MKSSEALIILNTLRNSPNNSKPVAEALKFAVEAVSLMVPCVPLPDNKYCGNGKCPRCNAVFIDRVSKHCGNCGQALDWSVKQ